MTNLPIRLRFLHEATAFKAMPGDMVTYDPTRPAGQRFTITRTAPLHEGQVARLLFEGALEPCDERTVGEIRDAMREQVTQDAYARAGAVA